jgi:hypothetical protein
MDESPVTVGEHFAAFSVACKLAIYVLHTGIDPACDDPDVKLQTSLPIHLLFITSPLQHNVSPALFT